MSEANERDVVADPLVDQVLEAVDRPALVCDREGVVRGWNGAFADRVGDERSVEGARVDAFVDWATDDPVAAALADGTTAAAVGKLRGNGRPDGVTVRPLTRESTVGAVVRFDDLGAEPSLRESRERLRTVLDTLPVAMLVVDADGRIDHVKGFDSEPTGDGDTALPGADLDAVADANETIAAGCRQALDGEASAATTAVGDRTFEASFEPVWTDGTVTGAIAAAVDVTDRERQRDELETVTAIQRLVHESIRGLTVANTSAEIKETVCDRLAASEFYRAAWIGSRTHSSTAVTPDYAAGATTEGLDSVGLTVDPSGEDPGPGGAAYRTGDVQVVGDVPGDPDFEPWRDAAVDRGYESVAVIPLTHGSTTHGVLAVYTDRTESFGDREVAGFEVLGEAVGFALSATQHRRLLRADRLLELEFVVGHDGPFLRASTEHDCRFVIENPVHASDGRVVNYLTVEGADPAVGAAAAESLDTLESMRRLDGDDGPDFELKWRRSVFQYLAEAGARGTRGTIEDGVGRMVVEAPGDVDVRRVTKAMETRFGEAELSAKRERERAEVPWWRVHGDISATLTDRQRAVLQAAYYSGYYEWPRDVDAETLAETLDVASTTLLQHLRKGHGRVLEAMFES